MLSPVGYKSELLGSHALERGNITAMIFINDSALQWKLKKDVLEKLRYMQRFVKKQKP